jgi:hypothetical protein
MDSITPYHHEFITPSNHGITMNPKQYSLADIKALQERQQTAHRGRSIYSDMRSISEDAFRNALENQALPIIEQLLQVVQKQHEALTLLVHGHKPHENEDCMDQAHSALHLGKPFIETHQSRLRREEGEQRSR